MVKVGHNGPEETTYVNQGVGLCIEMITANGWCAGGKVGGYSKGRLGECSVNGGDGKSLLYKLSPPVS